MGQIDKLKSALENKLYNYKAMLKKAEPNSEDFYCCRARVALCEELLISSNQILKEPTNEDIEKEISDSLQLCLKRLKSTITPAR